jgi:hypothetical protein
VSSRRRRSGSRRRSDLPTEGEADTDPTRSEEELAERLFEAADAVEDEDVRDELYKAIGEALERWAPESLKRAQRGELAPV